MGKLVIRTAVYFVILALFAVIFSKVSGAMGLLLLGAFVLAILNTLLRPLFILLTLPINFFVLGLASIFVNMLTIALSDLIMAGVTIHGFWINMLMAVVIMAADGFIRQRRKRIMMHSMYST